MNAEELLAQLRAECAEVLGVREESGRLLIDVPFFLPDGDGYEIAVEHGPEGWRLTDLGATRFYLSSQQVKWTRQRQWQAEDAVTAYGAKVDEETLVKPLAEQPSWYELAEFVQAIAQLTSIEFAGQRQPMGEYYRTRTTERLKRLVASEELVRPQWRDKVHDREGAYAADQALFDDPERPEPRVLAFAVGSRTTVSDTAMKALKWAEWSGLPRVAFVREEIDMTARHWRWLRDSTTDALTWGGEGDEETGREQVLNLLASYGIPLMSAA